MSTTMTTCPTCNQSYLGKQCPYCRPAIRLHTHRRPRAVKTPWDNPLAPGHWSQDPWLRLAIGLMVAQGSFLAFRRLIEAGLLGLGFTEQTYAWAGYTGFLVWGSLQIVCLFFGTLLAGSGQKEWLFYGLSVGFINTVVSLMQAGARYTGDITPWLLVMAMLLSLGMGVLGAKVGSYFWRPLQPAVPVAVSQKPRIKRSISVRDLITGLNILTVKVQWIKVYLGTAMALAGFFFSMQMFYWFVNTFQLREMIDSGNVQIRIFRLLISGLSILLGGFIAGSGSNYGPAQGIWSGIFTCIGYTIIILLQVEQTPTLNDLASAWVIILAIMIAGAIFGSRIMPPIVRTPKKSVSKPAEI